MDYMNTRFLIILMTLATTWVANAQSTDTIRACRSEVPYLYVNPNDADDKHSFENHLESWISKDGIVHTLAISEPVAIELQQQHIDLTLPCTSVEIDYSILLGNPDRFRLSYDSAWAAQSGKKDTVGILEGGKIVVSGLPHSLADREYHWALEVYNDSAVQAGFVCNIPEYDISLTARNEGMIGVKYGKLLFVPNGDDRWMGYEWYKDGVSTRKNGQYYHEAGTLLKGDFEVIATDTIGRNYRSTIMTLQPVEESESPVRRIEVMRVGNLIMYK